MEDLQEFGKFEEKGYSVEAFIHYFEAAHPITNENVNVSEWLVKISKDGELVKELKEPMTYFPRFGVDVSDIANLEEITDNFFREN